MDPQLVLTVPQKTARFRKRLKRVSKFQRIDKEKTSYSAPQYVELGDNVHERPGTFLGTKVSGGNNILHLNQIIRLYLPFCSYMTM